MGDHVWVQLQLTEKFSFFVSLFFALFFVTVVLELEYQRCKVDFGAVYSYF